jgi:hypothetical protein
VIAAARAALVPAAGAIEGATGLDDRELWQTGEAMFRHATRLRKSGRSDEAVPLYLGALARFERAGAAKDVSACLTGAGLAYLELAKAALREDLAAAHETLPAGGLPSIFALARQVVKPRALELASRSRLCHLWALELAKERQDLGGQAGRIANLAITEQLLGNLDTARRYVAWALDVHRSGGDAAAASIDQALLADIDRALGDEEAWPKPS